MNEDLKPLVKIKDLFSGTFLLQSTRLEMELQKAQFCINLPQQSHFGSTGSPGSIPSFYAAFLMKYH